MFACVFLHYDEKNQQTIAHVDVIGRHVETRGDTLKSALAKLSEELHGEEIPIWIEKI